jgi:predicted 2-oxoglutarate/Fe(II)-dependent dioxygenase YbiX
MAIEIFPGVAQFDFPQTLAKQVIKDVEKSKYPWMDSSVGTGTVAKHVRSSTSFGLDSLEISHKEVRPYMYECVKQYTSYYDVDVSGDDGLSLLKYESYDKYEFHTDYGVGNHRQVSCLIYLNPGEYEGGGTTFKHFEYTINPDSPLLVLFPSNYPYLHAANPVLSGKKYIIVTWMTDQIDNLMGHGPGCTCGK